jgi:hypothetical protein
MPHPTLTKLTGPLKDEDYPKPTPKGGRFSAVNFALGRTVSEISAGETFS